MAKRLQFRGGTTTQHSTFTGANREITIDTDKHVPVVHDGVTPGGYPLAKKSETVGLPTGLTDTQAKDAIYAAHNSKTAIEKIEGLQSSAIEIDGSVNLTVIPYGLNEIDDMTEIIQNVIDNLNSEYLLSNERLTQSKTIVIPEGKYKVENLHLKSGIKFNTIGVLEPLDVNSDCVFISGSYIEIDNLNISSRNILDYSGKLLSLDTSKVLTIDYLQNKSKLKKPAFIKIKNINLQNNEALIENNAIYFKSTSLASGIAWVDIDGNISNSYHGIDYVVENGGYINSTKFNGFITNCIQPISIYTGSDIGESSQNEFNIHIQPRANNLSRGIYNEGSLNTFKGVIWDWQAGYGLAINDLGSRNFYGSNLISGSFFQSHVRIASITTKNSSYYESIDSFNLNYHLNEEGRSVAGFQDNLLAYANKRYTVSVSPNTPSTLYKAFSQPQAINWASNTTWPSSDGGGEIIYTITGITSCRVSSIIIGFQKASRICSGIKVEYKNGAGSWTVLDTVTNNKSTRYLFRANGGSGYDLDSLRFTFTGGIDASNPKVLASPSSNILAIQSIGAFGAGERLSFVSPYDSKFINLTAISSSSTLNNSIFIDSADNKLKFKDNSGVINTLY